MSINKEKKVSILTLGIPIFIQLLLFNLLSTVDTLMISEYNENFIISMNNSSSIVHLLNVLLSICSTGVGIVIAQYLGAQKEQDAKKAFNNGLMFNLLLSGILFIFLFFFKENLLILIDCPEEYLSDAVKYISIVSLGMPLNALINILSTNLRVHKKPGYITLVAICSNIINVFLNYVLIYGKFNFPELGIEGAAIATVCSQIIMVTLGFILSPIILKDRIYSFKISLKHLYQIISIGLPSALESFCYTFSSLFVTSAVNQLTKSEMLARTYINIIALYIYQFSIAFGQANAILVGHLVGKGDYQGAKKRTFSSYLICFPILLILLIILNLCGDSIFSLLAKDKEESELIVKYAVSILPWLFLYETGRCVNLIYINALKATGDVVYPLIAAIICMFIFSSLGSWVLGIYLNLGFLGVFLAQALDELVRAILMLIRWSNNKWMNKSIVNK
jgi:putative MATE family efflux protein